MMVRQYADCCSSRHGEMPTRSAPCRGTCPCRTSSAQSRVLDDGTRSSGSLDEALSRKESMVLRRCLYRQQRLREPPTSSAKAAARWATMHQQQANSQAAWGCRIWRFGLVLLVILPRNAETRAESRLRIY